MSIFSMSEVYPPKLKTEEKRQHLTLANVDKYNKVKNDSHILVPDGSLYLIDMHHLTQGPPHTTRALSMLSCHYTFRWKLKGTACSVG